MTTMYRRERHRSERHAALDASYPSERFVKSGWTMPSKRPLFDDSPVASRAIGLALAFALGVVLFVMLWR